MHMAKKMARRSHVCEKADVKTPLGMSFERAANETLAPSTGQGRSTLCLNPLQAQHLQLSATTLSRTSHTGSCKTAPAQAPPTS